MKFTYKVLTKNEFKISNWSGGTTTELCIYPQNELYSDRKFIWRLSSATIDLEESTFTPLPDYNRTLVILDGKLTLKHENQQQIVLNTLDQTSFDGAFNTTSIGKVTDYNLMMKKGVSTGTVEVVNFISNFDKTLKIDNQYKKNYSHITQTYYNIENILTFTINDMDKVELNKGGMLIIDNIIDDNQLKLNIKTNNNQKAVLIMATIYIKI